MPSWEYVDYSEVRALAWAGGSAQDAYLFAGHGLKHVADLLPPKVVPVPWHQEIQPDLGLLYAFEPDQKRLQLATIRRRTCGTHEPYRSRFEV